MKKFCYLLLLMSFGLLFISNCKPKGNVYPIAWSHYTGWEPWDFADSAGILKKWGDKYNIKIKLVRVNDYVESINLFTAKKFYGCTMTNMDALTIPAVGGIDSTVLIIGDFSNGNDGIVTKIEKSIKQLKGKKVKLVQFSVSHYLLSRALSMNGMKDNELTLINTSDADIGTVFLSEKNGIAVTWNPILMKIEKSKNVNKIFDSSKIPGEIIDLMVVHSDAPESLKKALVGAWYETMSIISNNSKNSKALSLMAKSSGATVDEFKAQLKTTSMFYKAGDAAKFAHNPKLKKTMEYVRTFSYNNKLFGKDAASKDFVGIQFPDGSVLGDKKNIKLRFEAKYMQMSANNKL
ncbi:putative urea ABC transporter substrate-binding protein [Spirochaetota bacterium]